MPCLIEAAHAASSTNDRKGRLSETSLFQMLRENTAVQRALLCSYTSDTAGNGRTLGALGHVDRDCDVATLGNARERINISWIALDM
mmetsp:Transcript_29/g.61  ORF Transcript_29/g.61 Transcript_29/m.61 type:complete len:87 (+) Transcript_29:33-293(+)